MYPLFRGIVRFLRTKPSSSSLILVSSLLITLLAWQYSVRLDQTAQQQNFSQIARSAQLLLVRQIETQQQPLFDLRGFLSANRTINRHRFTEFAANVQTQKRYPAIHMLGYLPRISYAERAAFEAKMHMDGFQTYHIKSARVQDVYFPEFYIYPASRIVFGNNIYARSDRRLTMNAARDTDLPRATAQTTLDAGPKKQPAFVMYLPVYRHNMPLRTISDRRRALKGFLFETVLLGELVKAAVGPASNRQFELELHDNSVLTADRFIFDNDKFKDFGHFGGSSRFNYIMPVEIGGRNWTLIFHPTEAFYRMNKSSTPNIVLISGLLISLLLTGLSFQINARRRLKWAKEEQDQRYRSLFEQHPDAVYSMDLKGNITSANARTAKYAGLTMVALRNTPFVQFLDQQYLPEAMKCFRKASRGVPASSEIIAVGKDDRRFDLSVTNLPIVIEGRIIGVFGIAKDITRQKKPRPN